MEELNQMQGVSRFLVVFLGVGLFFFSTPAQAVMFTVSDISFSNLVGNDEALKWSVTAATTPIPHELNVGDSWTFSYGIFEITGPINSPAGDDNDDTFTASFNIMPPNPAGPSSRIGSPDGLYIQAGVNTEAYAWVDFIDTEIEKVFGIGGKYYVSFLDTLIGSRGDQRELQATIRLASDTEQGGDVVGATVVPEPSTLLLLGAGLAGLAIYRRKRS